VPLAPDAPSTYTVQAGDTLWDISSRFLRDPWYWPEIWYVNPEIQNPHLIYPGDVLRLIYVDGKPQVRLERGNTVRLSPEMRTTPLGQAISTIPYEIIAAFVSKPSVIAKEDVDTQPYILSLTEGRSIGGVGDLAYVRRLGKSGVGAGYNFVHVGDKLKDPDDGDVLGYQGIYVGSGSVKRAGDPATLAITESAREALIGDLLFNGEVTTPMDFQPHAPAKKIDGSIMSLIDGTTVVGAYQVVVINRGRKHGLEPGHVLSIWQKGEKVADLGPRKVKHWWQTSAHNYFKRKVELPKEHAGTVMVFKTYDRMSYGLVMEASGQIRALDSVRNP
jgi:hypothetical protein